jgi:hypothetical protein
MRFLRDERYSAGRLSILCVCLSPSILHSQKLQRSPVQVIDLNLTLNEHLSRGSLSSVDIAASDNPWAILLHFLIKPDETTIVTGDSSSSHAFVASGFFDRIAIDHHAHIYLRERDHKIPDTRISELDLEGNSVASFSIPLKSAIPLSVSDGVAWKTETALVSAPDQLISVISADENESIPERVFIGSLPGNKCFTFGSMSERIVFIARQARPYVRSRRTWMPPSRGLGCQLDTSISRQDAPE